MRGRGRACLSGMPLTLIVSIGLRFGQREMRRIGSYSLLAEMEGADWRLMRWPGVTWDANSFGGDRVRLNVTATMVAFAKQISQVIPGYRFFPLLHMAGRFNSSSSTCRRHGGRDAAC